MHKKNCEVSQPSYCEEYFRWVAEQDKETLLRHEYADADIDSAEAFYQRCFDGPPPNETPPENLLLEFDDLFTGTYVF